MDHRFGLHGLAVRGIGMMILAMTCGALPITASGASAVATGARKPGIADGYWVEQLADKLKFPWAMVWLPDGDMLVTERNGGLRRLHDGALLPKPIPGVPQSYQAQQNGLQGIALDPDFATTRRIFLSIAEGTTVSHHAAVYSASYAPDGLSDLKLVFRSKDDIGGVGPTAGPLLFLPDKTFLFAVTDNHYYRQRAQLLSSDVGKIVRLNRDGSVPADNPFVKTPGVLPEIWSYGHRVPLGLYRDEQTGWIWEVEPGPRGGDEVNILKKGGNFGWGIATWGFDYNGGLAGIEQFGPGIEDPVVVWTPSVSPSGITRYRGSAYPQWNGDFFVGHLTTKELTRLRMDDRRMILEENMLTGLDERIRAVQVGPDGLLYILTDNDDGRVLRLRPGAPSDAELARVADKIPEPDFNALAKAAGNGGYAADFTPGDPVKGKAVFLERCASCHSVTGAIQGGDIGPNLVNVYGHHAGRVTGHSYSAAMGAAEIVWDRFSLDLFLADPRQYVPGTAMSAPPVTDNEERRQIIGFLKQSSDLANQPDPMR